MKPTLPNPKSLSPFARNSGTGHSENIDTETIPEPPKPPPELTLFFMLSHLEDDGPVRLDGVKLAVSEVMGLELDEPKLGAFAGSLNALDFPVQLLVRQHPPVLQGLRAKLDEAQPEDLPQQTKDAADSLGRLLTTLETREGILDRRFYAVCEHDRMDELRGLLARGGLASFRWRENPAVVLAVRRAGRVSDRAGRKPGNGSRGQPPRHPRRQAPDPFAAPGQVAPQPHPRFPARSDGRRRAHGPVGPPGRHSAEQAARTLEWQKVRFESAQSLSFKRGRSMSPEAEIALGGREPSQGRGAKG